MLNQSYGKRVWLVFFIGLVFAAATVFSYTLTQAQGEKASEQKQTDKGQAKKPRLEDAIERLADGSVRAKPGFEIRQTSDTTFSVRRATEEIARLKCSVCPGGKCRGTILSGGARCRGCGGGRCLIDPF
jgi:hypothetical protein